MSALRLALRLSLGAALGLGLAVPALAGETLPMQVSAEKDAAYEIFCKVKTYRTKDGGFVNRYGISFKGPFVDTIPSPNADCSITKTGGKGPVTLRIVRFGKKPFVATVAEVGQKADLSVF